VNLLAALSSDFGLLATTPLILGSCFYIAGVFWGIFLGSNTKSQSAVIQAVTFSAFLLSR